MDKTLEILIIVMLLGIMAEIYITTRPKRALVGLSSVPAMLVDTSVLMDGRVVDLAKTGFLMGQVVVPRSVLAELQFLADGGDHTKRERARFGMDAMKELKDVLGASFTLLDDETKVPEGVDARLLILAKQMNAAVLTLDYNLNKVAQVEGVRVLNINELAKSLRMSHLPGDVIDLELSQKGQDSHQAVGYLRDGTMVVVEQGKKYLGQSRPIEIIRSLQTDAGKMMFAKLVPEVVAQPEAPQQKVAPAPKQRSGGRKPQPKQQPAAIQEAKQPASNKQPQFHNPVRAQKPTAPIQKKKSDTRQFRRPKSSAEREAELIRLVDGQE